jgi:hypothetical protein
MKTSKVVLGLSLAAVLGLSGAARAQDKKDEKKDAKPAGMEMPKPGPEHKKLNYFVGNWKLAGEVKPGAMGPGGKMTGTSNCTWFDGHFAIVCKDSGNGPMGPGKGMGVITYNAEDKKYEYMGIDSMGMSIKAEGTVENDVWSYLNEGKMNGKPYKGRYSIMNTKPDSYDFKFEMSDDGNAWNTVMEGKYTRAGGAAAAAKPAAKKS